MLKHLLTIKNLDSAKKGVVLAEYYLACEQALGEIRPWEVTRERHAKGDASAFSRGPSLATRNKEELAHSDDTFAKDPLVSCGLAKCSLGNCGEIPSFISLLPYPRITCFLDFSSPPSPRQGWFSLFRGCRVQLGPVGPLTSCLTPPVIIFCAINLSISFISNSFFFFITGGCCIPRTQKYKAVAGKWKCLWAWAGLSKVERYCIRVL